MQKQYIYVDESGDLELSKNSSKFLIISALITDDPKQLDRIIKNARRNKFKKELKNAKEIKFNKSNPQVRKYFINKLNETLNCLGIHCILEKKKLSSFYLKENKDKLYNYVAGYLGDAIILNCDKVEIRIDKSKIKSSLREDFNNYFKQKLINGSNITDIVITHSYSENFSGIQFADLLAGTVYNKFNNCDSQYIDIIDQDKFPQTYIELWK